MGNTGERDASGLVKVVSEARNVCRRLCVLAMDVGGRSSNDHAHVFDTLFSGKAPLVDLLSWFAGYREDLEEEFGHMRTDPIAGARFVARSWHGLLAMWADRVASYARAYWGPLRRRLLGKESDIDDSLGDLTVTSLLDGAKDEQRPSVVPDPTRAFEELENFTERIREALDGFVGDGPKVAIGIRIETQAATRTSTDGADTDAASRKADIPAPEAIAAMLVVGGKSLVEIARQLRLKRRQDFYEKPEWAQVLHLARTRAAARRQARDERRAGQNPDTEKNLDDA